MDENQENKFKKYLKLLMETPFNITSIKSPDLIIYRHFIDSLKLALFLDFSSFETVLDIGSGAGFPGVPLKIIHPQLKLTLLESSRKKALFLKSLVSELELAGVEVLWQRAEDLGRASEKRESYDLVVARALASLRVLLELSLPLLKIGGILVAYKGKKLKKEIEEAKKALKLLNGTIERVEEYIIKGIDFKGNLVFIKKEASTPSKFPRRPGIPFKRPL
ncbi:MAG: 16S rRNA (guanine(527)-N(7))-methyltransferase RsmG [Synergistetes bacterium]|nr:16S rRNA (guanine(527)-N(7))-methyltransferase RsmG [Synergistota bacterium]